MGGWAWGGGQPELGSTVRLGSYYVYSPSPREESGTFGLPKDFGMNGMVGGAFVIDLLPMAENVFTSAAVSRIYRQEITTL